MGAIDVKHTQEHELTLEWESSASNDMIADSTLALITGIDKSPASVKRRLNKLLPSFFVIRILNIRVLTSGQ
jgi:cleavage and polyadenylation specificity factor subunit 3